MTLAIALVSTWMLFGVLIAPTVAGIAATYTLDCVVDVIDIEMADCQDESE